MTAQSAPELALAEDVLAFGRDYLRVGEGDLAGQAWKWLPFQEAWIRDTFRPGVRRSILSVGRRNGKTATCAALVCASLIGPLKRPGSFIVSASRSREQASIVFRYCVKILRLSGLDHLVKIRDAAREIEEPTSGTRFKAISAEATTAVGFGASLILVDELGQNRGPHDKLYDALSTSLGSYSDSLMVIISTQAPTDTDLLSILIDSALPGNDPSLVCHLHAADEEANPWSPESWAAANPAMGVFRDRADIENQAREAQRLPTREGAFRNYTLNQRESSEAPFLTASVFGACAGDPSEDVLRAGPSYAGLDLSSRQDLTSLAIVAEDDESKLHLKVFSWTPSDTVADRAHRDRADYELWIRQDWLRTTPGVSISYDHIAAELCEIFEDYNVVACNYDRWRIDDLRQRLEGMGATLPLVPCGQGYKDMSPAVEQTLHAFLSGEILHGGNPVLTWAVGNAVLTQDPAGNSKLDKMRSFGRIDPAVAMTMAVKAARFDVEEQGQAAGGGIMFV